MTREALHRLIDQLPDSELGPTAALFEAARSHDRALIQALLADEEALEPGDAEALAEVDRGDTIDAETLERRYGVA
jgi:hypothetical protein